MDIRSTLPALVVLALFGCSTSSGGQDAAADKVTVDVAAVGVDAVSCDAPRVGCGAACVSLRWDYRNCGQCGRRCQGHEVCYEGACVRGNVCPERCTNDDQCRTCTYSTDPTVFCCIMAAGATTGRCSLVGGCRRGD